MTQDFVAIVGGSGFVGSRLARRFSAAQHRYQSFDIDNSCNAAETTFVDVRRQETLGVLSGASAIINLAAVHRDDVRPLTLYDDVNVEGAKNVCSTASKYGIKKIIFTSSVAVYGFAPRGTSELGQINFFNDYGRTKYEAEEIYKHWQSEDPDVRSLVIIRPTVVFGEGNRGNVYNLLNQINSKKFVMIGSGKNIKSMAYVENVAAFIQQALLAPPGIHVSNYVDKPDLSVGELVSITRGVLIGKSGTGPRLPAVVGLGIGFAFDLLSWMVKRPLAVSSIRVKKFLSDSHFESNARSLGFEPPFSLLDALDRTLHYEFIENTKKDGNLD